MADLDAELDAELAAPDPGVGPLASSSPLDAELDAELAAADQAAPTPAPVAPAPVPMGPRRVNMLDPSGNLVNVSEAFVPTAYASGYRLDKSEIGSGPVQLREDGGRVNTYEANSPELQRKLDEGNVLATPEEVEQEYGDFGSQVAAGLEGVAQGGTLGLYGLAADAIGGQDARAERQLREELNPVTSTAGNLLGAVGTAVATGGAGAVGRAAAATPAGMLANLSAKGLAALAPRVTSTAGRIALHAGVAAGEGAIDNAARQVFDDLGAGDVEGFSERALDAAWEGAKWGGLLGGGAAAVGEVAGRLGRRADDAAPPPPVDEAVPAQPEPAPRAREEVAKDLELAQQRLAEADAVGEPNAVAEAEDAFRAAQKEFDESVASEMGMKTETQIEGALKVTPESQSVLQGLVANLRKAKTAKDLELRFDDVVEAEARAFGDDIDNLQRAWQNDVQPRVSRNNKPGAIDAALTQEMPVWTLEDADKALAGEHRTLDALDKAIAEASEYGDDISKSIVKDFKKARGATESLIESITGVRNGPILPNSRILRANKDDLARIFWLKDTKKSHLGRWAATKNEVPTPSEALLQKLYMREAREELQNEKLWGNLANMQTTTNAAEAKAIPAMRSFKNQFSRSRGVLSEHAGEFGFDLLSDIDPGSVKALLRGELDYKQERDFFAGLLRTIELAEAKAPYYPRAAKVADKIANARKVYDDLQQRYVKIKTVRATKDAAVRAAKETGKIESALSLVELASQGTPLVQFVGQGVTSLGRLADSVINMMKGAVKTEQAVDNAAKATAKNFFRGSTEPKAPKASKGPRGGLGITGNQLRKAVEDSQALQDPESEQSRRMTMQLDDVRRESPELANAMASKAMAKAEFILGKMGPKFDDSDPFRPGRQVPMDKITQLRMARYVAAAQDPKGALKRMSEGVASLEDIETMKTLYPKLYDSYRQKLVAEVEKAKVPPTILQQQKLFMMTGIPMSREQTPEYIASMQAMAQPVPEEQPVQPKQGPKFTGLLAGEDSFGARSDQLMTESVDS